jgi:hypothetical protein
MRGRGAKGVAKYQIKPVMSGKSATQHPELTHASDKFCNVISKNCGGDNCRYCLIRSGYTATAHKLLNVAERDCRRRSVRQRLPQHLAEVDWPFKIGNDAESGGDQDGRHVVYAEISSTALPVLEKCVVYNVAILLPAVVGAHRPDVHYQVWANTSV